jgi:predicted HTH domain antitoxin
MDTVTIPVELPRDLLVALNVPAARMGEKTREWMTLELYREQLISAGKAAEVLGLTKSQFIDLLAQRDIAYLDLTATELAEDVHAATAAIMPKD